jgi:hypothetical protein
MGLTSDSTHYIVFNSNQAKLTSNENPTENDDIRHSLEVKQNLTPEENNFILSELMAKNNRKDSTTFTTKDGKIGVRNNRSLYIVDEMNDTDDAYRPIRIYDVDIKEDSSTVASEILKEIEDYEKAGRRVS